MQGKVFPKSMSAMWAIHMKTLYVGEDLGNTGHIS